MSCSRVGGSTCPAGAAEGQKHSKNQRKGKARPCQCPSHPDGAIQSFLGAPQLSCTATPIPDQPCLVLLQQRQKIPSFQVPRSCWSNSWSRSLKCASCSDFEALEQEFEGNPIHPHAQHIRAQQQLWGSTVRERRMVRARQGEPAQGSGDRQDTEISRCHINSCEGNASSGIKYLPWSGTGL